MANQKIRIKLKSFDHTLVDKSAEKIIRTVKSTGAVVAKKAGKGPRYNTARWTAAGGASSASESA